MENSMYNLSRASYCNVKSTYSTEESSWAMYLEDILDSHQEHSSFSSGYESPSLISDADSTAIKKLGTTKNVELYLDESCKKLSWKRRKIVDDSLEDTASSPVIRPKDFTTGQLSKNLTNMDTRDESLGLETTVEHESERNGLMFLERVYYTGLQRKGLCLVPLSILGNYLG